MKKIIRVSNLDCANCAAKLELALAKIGGVTSAAVSFLAQKITLEIADGKEGDVMNEVFRVCKRVEPDMEIRS